MREAAADEEWLMDPTKSFHVLRDNPDHSAKILGGLWGAKLYLNRTIWKKLHHVLFQLGYKRPQQYGFDQNLLGVQNEKQYIVVYKYFKIIFYLTGLCMAHHASSQHGS